MGRHTNIVLSPADLRSLERMWPNRTHESSWLKDVICALGFHRWHSAEVRGPDSNVSNFTVGARK